MTDDTRLEAAFRSGLQRRADDVDTAVDLLGPARVAARDRRRRRLAATAAAGVAAAALVTAVVVQGAGDDRRGGAQVVDDGIGELPTRWRTEAWHGLQVEVPADWGWGSAPMGRGEELTLCGDLDPARPYVGRPVLASDACVVPPPSGTPSAPYVWLGVDLPPGEQDLGNGWRQVTVGVEGTTLTVASDDPRLAQRVIDSARPVEGCAPQVAEAPAVREMLVEGLRAPSSAQVCAYRRDAQQGTWWLTYARSLDARQAAAYHAAVYDGGRDRAEPGCAAREDERVLVTVVGDDPYGDSEVSQDTVVFPSCREVEGAPGSVTPLGEAGMDAWGDEGARATLSGLIGVLG